MHKFEKIFFFLKILLQFSLFPETLFTLISLGVRATTKQIVEFQIRNIIFFVLFFICNHFTCIWEKVWWLLVLILGCGGNIRSDEGNLTSPFYPSTYSYNLNCQWFITVSKSRNIKLTFKTFDVHKTYGCLTDFVEVREYGKYGSQKSLGRYCGTRSPGRVTNNFSF